MKKFNINEYVHVKLTPHGYEVHRKYWTPFSGGKYVPPYRNIDGWSKFQLWDLMVVFGPAMIMGLEIPFETEILFEVDGL